MRAADDANIPEHIAEMRKQYNKLIQKGCKISDEEFKSVLVMSLPASWDYFVASFQGSATKDGKPGGGNTSQDLISILQDEYQRRSSQQTHAFYAQSTSQNKKTQGGIFPDQKGQQKSVCRLWKR